MAKHTTLSVYDYNRVKLCELCDNEINAPGQAYDIAYTKETNGWKQLTFVLPHSIKGKRNFRWDYVKNETLIRYTEGDQVDWFLVNAPNQKHDFKGIETVFSCDHISAVLKTKNLYVVFDDENGIGEIEELAEKILIGTGWSLGECDGFYEADGVTKKKRSIRSDGKVGAYQLIQDLCDLFCGYPEFDGDQKLVHLRCLNRREAQQEMILGKNIVSIDRKMDTNNIVTRLYVEGEYTEDGYVGIDGVNPTGLSFLLNFDYYKQAGQFTQTHQEALDKYVLKAKEIKDLIMNLASQRVASESDQSSLWGQPRGCLYKLQEGNVIQYELFGDADDEDAALTAGNQLTVLHNDGTFTQLSISNNGITFAATDVYAIKWLTRAAGKIGGKEVAVEAKEKMIEKHRKELAKENLTEARKTELEKLIKEAEDNVSQIHQGGEDSEGLYSLMHKAVELFLEIVSLEDEQHKAIQEQDKIEAAFVVAMGDMLKDGYWNDPNYVVGQEKNLYEDSLGVMKDLSSPDIKYNVSIAVLRGIKGFEQETFDLNTSVRVYDEELNINDFAYVSKTVHHPQSEDKDTVEISNEYIDIKRKTFESVLSRITYQANILDVKKTIYDRSEAVGSNGSIPAVRLEGTIDLLKARISSVVSNWYTDENGNIIFESADGNGAMQLCGEGFMIADGKQEDGSWNWRTFGTGKGFTADEIIAGYLSADRIEAGSITLDKLENDIGTSIDLANNGAIQMVVQKSVYTGIEPPRDPKLNMLWLDTDGENVLKRWDGSQWIKCSISESEVNEKISQNLGDFVTEEQLQTNLTSSVEQTVNSYTVSFTTSIENQQGFKSKVETYQKFSEDGIELGKNDSQFKAKLGNEKLSFLQNTDEIAYISNHKMYIKEAEVSGKMSLGTKDGWFDWVVGPKGLALKWRG